MPTATTPTPGIRERKKARTRQAIIDAAMDLFEKQGYEETTINEIAEAADIAPRTFFGYFPTKEDVVFYDFQEAERAQMREILTERDPGTPALDALREWAVGLIESEVFDPAAHARHTRLVASSPTLASHDALIRAELEGALRVAFAQDLDLPEDHMRPRMLAAAAGAALRAIADGIDPDSDDDPMAQLDEALGFLRAGFAELERG